MDWGETAKRTNAGFLIRRVVSPAGKNGSDRVKNTFFIPEISFQTGALASKVD